MSLSRSLVTIYKGFNKYISQFFALEGFSEITANSYQYLIAVYKLNKYEGQATTTGVAHSLGVKNSSAVQMINNLVKSGYLNKRESNTDKRSSILEMSEKGWEMMRLEEQFSDKFMQRFFSTLTIEEIASLESIAGKIAAKIEEQGNV